MAHRYPGLSFFATLALLLAVTLVVPMTMSVYGTLQLASLAVMAIFALSQGFVWGHAGIMSFGQASFLGLGGYAYAVTILNSGDSTPAIACAVAVPMIFAAILGYFMFYGRISEAYVAAITLTVSVILFQLVNASSGSAYHIGKALLGGFNGIPAVPAINAPGRPGEPISQRAVWYVAMACLMLVYALLRGLLATRFGRAVVAVRENAVRAQLLGYDARLYRLAAFVIGAGIAGLAGCLYVNWAGYIGPDIFALTISAQAIIFVLVGGIGSLVGPMLGAALIQYLLNRIGDQNALDPGLTLGLILIAFVLLLPGGLVSARERLMPLLARRRSVASTEPA